MEPVLDQLIPSLSQLSLKDRPATVKQTENSPSCTPDLSTKEARFNFLCERGIIDSNGIATPAFMREGLQRVPDESKVKIYNAVHLDISPKKDTKAILPQKMEQIQSVFQRLSQVYGDLFPFRYNPDTHTAYFNINFSLVKLISFLKGQITIDKEIEMIGSGVVTMLGPGFYANQIYSWLDLPQVDSKEHSPINDYDFWIQTDSLEKAEEIVIEFLLYSIPSIEYIAATDLNDFRFLIRELAFKNICSINGQKTIISFCNNCGPDFDFTFSKTKMQPPFAFCNGLIIGIPTDFTVQKITAPYVAKEVNPAQCIADQFIGLLNGPTLYNPDKRVDWILSKWTSGRWLFSTPWQEEIVKTIHAVTFDPTDQRLAEKQFVKMAEAINLFLLMRKLGLLQQSSQYIHAFSKALLEHSVFEKDTAYQLLFSLFHRFRDPIKGIYYLYLISLYTMPLKKAAPFQVEASRNGSFECFSLKIGFKNTTRTLYFSGLVNETIAPLTEEELSTVQGWLSYFIQGAELVPDQALFDPFRKSNSALDPHFGCFFACEEALFSKEYPCYEQFFDLAPLAKIIQPPLFAIARINAQLHLREKPGFDLTEKALQEGNSPLEIAWAFIQDAMNLAPFAIRKAIPTLIEPSPELLLDKWIESALLYDKELAASLLRYSAKLPAEKQLSLLQRLLKTSDSPLFDEAVCSLISQLLPSTLFQKSKIVLDCVMWAAAHERSDICSNLLGQAALLMIFNKTVHEESGFTAEACCHILNGCGPHFIANSDDKNLLFWVTTLLDCLKTEKKEAAACLKMAVFIECLQQIKDPVIYSHNELATLLSENESEQVYASFLKDLLKHALETNRPIVKNEAIALYSKFFAKLALKSPEEEGITSQFIALLCNDIDTVLSFFKTIGDLCCSFLLTKGLLDLAKNPVGTLLWCEAEVQHPNLEPWRERFFEIACALMHTLLDLPPQREKENGVRLDIVAQLLSGILKGNPRRKLVIPIYEKMVFSPLSICSSYVYKENVRKAEVLYVNSLLGLPILAEYPHHCYKTKLIIHRASTDTLLNAQEQRTLFNEVLDFLIRAKQPLALHIMCNIMRDSSPLIFGNDNALQKVTLLKIIDAAFAMPHACESEDQRVDLLELCTSEQALQTILKKERWNAYVTFFFTLFTTSNPEEKRLHLFRQFVRALLTSDNKKVIAIGKKFYTEGMKKEKFRESLLIDPDLKELLEPPVPTVSSKQVTAETLFVLLEKAVKSTCPTLKKEAIDLYNQVLPTLTPKSLDEWAVTELFIALMCKEINSSLAFLTQIFNLANAVLAQLGHKDLANDGSQVLLWCPDENFISSYKKPTRHATLESLLPWKNRFFEIACALMHALLDAPSTSENENEVRLDIVAKMIKNMAQGNKRAQALAPIFEKMIFSPLSLCNATVYNNNLDRAHAFYAPLSVFNFYTFDPRSQYKIGLVLDSAICSNSPLAPEVKRSLFNQVLDFQIKAKQPKALGPMINFMYKHSLSIFGKDDDNMRIEILWKLINAAFEMPYAKMSVTQAHIMGLTITNELPLLPALIGFILNDERQLITYNNADAAKKGYPIVKEITAKLVHLCIEGKDEVFLDALLSLLKQVLRYHLFESEAQYLDLLQSVITSPMLQKICTLERWDRHVTSYSTLLAFSNPQEERRNLFRQFIIELLKSDNKKIFERGKKLLIEGMQKGIYRGKILDDHEIMELHRRTFPDFSVEEFLFDCLKKEKKEAAACMKRENILEQMKTLKDPSILAHKEIQKLFSEQELQLAYANFLEGVLERALKTNCLEIKGKAIDLYLKFFPKLALKSPEERHVTQLAFKLYGREEEDTTTPALSGLATSALEAAGHSDLAIYGIDVLIFSPDAAFTYPQTNKKFKRHVKLKSLQPLKERFFEIAVEFMHILLDTAPKHRKDNGRRLEGVEKLILGMIQGNSRSKQLVPIFEKMVFSRLSTCDEKTYLENCTRTNDLHELLVKYASDYPSAMYKTTLICHRTELADSSLTSQEKLALFNEVLDFQISTKQPYALQIMCDLMINLSNRHLIFERNDELKIAALEKIIDACVAMPYARASMMHKAFLTDPSTEKSLKATGLSINFNKLRSLGSIPLLQCLVDCVVDSKRQLITHDEKDAARKGYPIIKRLTEQLVSLCIKEEGHQGVTFEEFVNILFTLWYRTWRYNIYESNAQHVDLLKLCVSTPMLQKICTSESWETLLTSYFYLIVWPGSLDEKEFLDLFRQFIVELLKSDDKKISDKGRALFIEGQKKGMYPGEIIDDPDLIKILT
ncbi:MAG: hypothetical protein JSR46_11635 [Verrucomicrobia bacterium]|nr:hypothetical protein [Verrucomicrobiota bacterium]